MPHNNLTKKCRYVLEDYPPDTLVYCDEPVLYKTLKDSDGVSYTFYETWCQSHSEHLFFDMDDDEYPYDHFPKGMEGL